MATLTIVTAVVFRRLSARLEHRPHAPSADVHRLHLAFDLHPPALYIRLKVTIGPPLRVTDVVSEALGLSANITHSGHGAVSFPVRHLPQSYSSESQRRECSNWSRKHSKPAALEQAILVLGAQCCNDMTERVPVRSPVLQYTCSIACHGRCQQHSNSCRDR